MTNIFDNLTLGAAYNICWFMHSGENATVAKWQLPAADVAYVKAVIAELDAVIEPEKIRGYVGNYAIYQFVEDLLSIATLEFGKVNRERPFFAKEFEDNATHMHTYVPPQLNSLKNAAASMKLTPEQMRQLDERFKNMQNGIVTAPDTYLNAVLPIYAYIAYLELKIIATGGSSDDANLHELRSAYAKLRQYVSAEKQQAIDSGSVISDFIASANGEVTYSLVDDRQLPSKH